MPRTPTAAMLLPFIDTNRSPRFTVSHDTRRPGPPDLPEKCHGEPISLAQTPGAVALPGRGASRIGEAKGVLPKEAGKRCCGDAAAALP